MKKAIVTVTIGNCGNSWGKFSHPSFKAYAKRVGADFVVLDKEDITLEFHKYGFHYPKYEEFKIKDILNSYERVLYVDTDAFIKPNCPDVFEIVPYEKIGGVYDNKENIAADQHRIGLVKKVLGNINWEKGYINCGIYVVSKIHREMFNIIEKAISIRMWDQDVINFNLNKLGFEIHRLDTKFNSMFLYGYPTNGEIRDVDAYIVHFAACGRREERLQFLYERYKDEIIRGLA